ncbi:MAG: ribosome silencing factor, partial [Myxococcota bacterium]
RRGGRPVLRVSHGSKTSDARPSPPRVGLSSPSSPSKPSAPIPKPPKRKRPTAERHSSETVHTALAIARAALEKKAANLEIIDLVGKADYADYLVLMSGGSERHVRALADEIQDQLHKKKLRPLSVEGMTACTWVLLDYGDVVVHVFQESARAVYDLDGLWLDAARVPVPDDTPSHS